jgi:hypothetical protein
MRTRCHVREVVHIVGVKLSCERSFDRSTNFDGTKTYFHH